MPCGASKRLMKALYNFLKCKGQEGLRYLVSTGRREWDGSLIKTPLLHQMTFSVMCQRFKTNIMQQTTFLLYFVYVEGHVYTRNDKNWAFVFSCNRLRRLHFGAFKRCRLTSAIRTTRIT